MTSVADALATQKLVENRIVLLIVALGRGGGELANRLRAGVGKRGTVREKRSDVGLFVDSLDANRPASRPEVARVPREAAGTVLQELVP